MRCFVGIRLGASTRDRIVGIQRHLQSLGLFSGKFTEPENLHLTLKFLGDLDEPQIDWVRARLRTVHEPSFEAVFDRLGVFSPQRIRIIWVHMGGPEALQAAVDEAVRPLYKPEERFMSHVTIARPKTVGDRQELLRRIDAIELDAFTLSVEDFCLYRSDLTSEGPVYSEIERFSLR